MNADRRSSSPPQRHSLTSSKTKFIGIGTGSTVNFFIDALAARKLRIRGAVSSSESSTARLKQHGIEVLDLNATGDLDVYVDGADEADPQLRLIKGGGAALTREKIVAAASRRFVCIVDDSKLVDVLGRSRCRSKSSRWRARTSPASWCGSADTRSIARAS